MMLTFHWWKCYIANCYWQIIREQASLHPLTTILLMTFTTWRSETVKWQRIANLFFFFSSSATSCTYSKVWHIAPFHAWQKSVQEANHCYCQTGTAVYSSIMQSSLTVTDHHVFHISSELDVDLFQHPLCTGKNTSSQHLLCQTVLCQYFSFLFVFKISQTSQLFCTGSSSSCTFLINFSPYSNSLTVQ